MAFLSTSDFAPLFQLLNTCDNYEPHRTRPTQSRRIFAPAFDVRELSDGYYLDGELPGVNQSNIDIEFSDSHTLVVKGHADRDYKTTDAPIAPEPRVRSRQATVEDDDESDSGHSDTAASTTSSKSTPVPTPGPEFKYWASERSVGEFKRTFNFPSRVDQDAVRASLKNGVLSIVVPKEAAPKAKKIRIE